MKISVLLLAVGLTAANTFAQVHSQNVVGFVKTISVPANSLAILAVPLNGTNNLMNTTMPLPPGSDGCTVYRFDFLIQSSYLDPITWFDGFGWFSASDPAPTVNPGEGIWFQNVTAQPIGITYLGDVPRGTLNNPLPVGINSLKLISSIVPKAGPPGDRDRTDPIALGFPACDGDTIYIWDVATQTYKEPYNYFDGFGWYSANPDDPGPCGPVIPVATGFWIQSSCPPPRVWSQTFTAN